MKTFTWAIVGAGQVAHQVAAALRACRQARTVAVFSRSPDKAAAFADAIDAETEPVLNPRFCLHVNAVVLAMGSAVGGRVYKPVSRLNDTGGTP